MAPSTNGHAASDGVSAPMTTTLEITCADHLRMIGALYGQVDALTRHIGDLYARIAALESEPDDVTAPG